MKNISFNDYNLNITLTPFINIVGVSGAGKTNLLNTLINRVNSNNVFIDGKSVSSYDINFLRKNVAAVLKTQMFKTKYVKDELMYYQLFLGISKSDAEENVSNFVKFFELVDIIDLEIIALTEYQKAYLKILSLLIIKPMVLGIDDLLTFLTIKEKMKIIKYAKMRNISILNVTTNPEELLLGTDIIILDHLKVVAYDKSDVILDGNKYLSKIGMNEPFIASLSNNLDYYDLLKKKYFDMKALVEELWK